MTKRTSDQLQEELRTLKKLYKTLEKKAILRKRENVGLGKLLEQKDKDLNLERSLWSSRKADWDSGANTDLHRIEVFDSVISDESSLHSATLCDIEKFQYTLEHVKAYATASNEMSLFYDDESRASDPGSRCKLRLRHVLLLALVRKKDNLTQGTLQAIFGVDQTTVCRYLKAMDRILVVVLPTAKNISKDIAECETKHEFVRFQDAEVVLARAFADYNNDRIHSALGYVTPNEFARKVEDGNK